MTDDAIAIVGGGAFGTALAAILATAGRGVTLIVRDEARAAAIDAARENRSRLPGVRLPPRVAVTADRSAVTGAAVVLMAVPAQETAATLAGLADALSPGVALIACAKGVERETGRLQSDIFADLAPQAVPAALSGPGFAEEIARFLPTAVTIAADDPALAARLCLLISTDMFRPYASGDLAGVEIGGAVKNVLAIACGVVAGRGLGESARAALIARGLAEMTRFGVAHGGRAETFTGLSGLGDLVLTAMSPRSRNTAFGMALGRGEQAAALMAADAPLAEGAFTAGIAARLAARAGVDMPITAAVAAVIDGDLSVDEAIAGLVTRPLRSE